MKKNLFLSILFFVMVFSFVPLYSQEIVIFQDDRALVVSGHSEKNGFVYLRISEGEFAVPKSRIKEIKKENVSLTTVSIQQTAPGGFLQEKSPGNGQTKAIVRGPMQKVHSALSTRNLVRATPLSATSKNDNNSDEEANSNDEDNGGNEAEAEPEEPQTPAPQRPMMLPTKTIATDGPVIRQR